MIWLLATYAAAVVWLVVVKVAERRAELERDKWITYLETERRKREALWRVHVERRGR